MTSHPSNELAGQNAGEQAGERDMVFRKVIETVASWCQQQEAFAERNRREYRDSRAAERGGVYAIVARYARSLTPADCGITEKGRVGH